MKYYVIMDDDVVIGGPFELSSSESASPNIYWPITQMKLNGYLPADLSHDPETEKVDFSNPLVTSDIVVYGKTPLTKGELDAKVDAKRLREYPTESEEHKALWASIVDGDNSLIDQILVKRNQVDTKYPKT